MGLKKLMYAINVLYFQTFKPFLNKNIYFIIPYPITSVKVKLNLKFSSSVALAIFPELKQEPLVVDRGYRIEAARKDPAGDVAGLSCRWSTQKCDDIQSLLYPSLQDACKTLSCIFPVSIASSFSVT